MLFSLISRLKDKIKKRYLDVGLDNLYNREKWLKDTLLKIPSGQKILDAGAGECKYKSYCAHLKYKSQDLGQYDGIGNYEGKQTKSWDNSKLDIISDIVNIPVQDGSFDAIMCIEVFEHISEPAMAIKEFSRILRSGGKLIITAPFSSITHFAPFYFANGYSKYWYEKILPEYRFTIDEININGNYFEWLAQEVRRIPTVTEDRQWEKLKFSDRVIQTLMLKMLARLSKKDRSSNKILCHGIHILATKE